MWRSGSGNNIGTLAEIGIAWAQATPIPGNDQFRHNGRPRDTVRHLSKNHPQGVINAELSECLCVCTSCGRNRDLCLVQKRWNEVSDLTRKPCLDMMEMSIIFYSRYCTAFNLKTMFSLFCAY